MLSVSQTRNSKTDSWRQIRLAAPVAASNATRSVALSGISTPLTQAVHGSSGATSHKEIDRLWVSGE
jgi:hypothetical protein